jgi:hypothetical protein
MKLPTQQLWLFAATLGSERDGYRKYQQRSIAADRPAGSFFLLVVFLCLFRSGRDGEVSLCPVGALTHPLTSGCAAPAQLRTPPSIAAAPIPAKIKSAAGLMR